MLMNEECVNGKIKEGLVQWFVHNCQNCPHYAGIANEKRCLRDPSCLSEGAFKEIKGELRRFIE